jgi:IclR family pca regulon transcriptional regulator
MPPKRKVATAPVKVVVDAPAVTAGTDSSLFVNSVGKAFRVLSAFQTNRSRLSLSQIASLAGLDMSAAQRFTYTLLHLHLLRKDPETKMYELSPRMLDFAYQYIATNELVSRATPFIQQLAVETEESVNITTLDGAQIVFLQRLISRHVLMPQSVVGSRLPAYCTSAGLAMLSVLPEHRARAILEASDLVKHTKFTMTNIDAILKRLKKFREVGYAHIEDELYLGDIATAVPVVTSDGSLLGAINIGVARTRWKGAEDEARISSLLMSAARAISSRL